MKKIFFAIGLILSTATFPMVVEGGAGKGALTGGLIGLGVGGLVDGGLGIASALASAATGVACDNPPCKADTTSTATYIIVPLVTGTVGAGFGALIGNAVDRDDVAIVPIVFVNDEAPLPTGGGLSVCKEF